MKRVMLTLTMIVFAAAAYADVPRPDRSPAVKKPKAVDAYLSISFDRDAKEARLIIPKSEIKALRAQLDGVDDSEDAATASNISRVQIIVSGVFLSLAVAFAGVWFARGRRLASGAGPAAAAVVFALGAFATIVYGNAGPPSAAREVTGRMFSPALHVYKSGGGRIKLEISDTDSQVKLIVPDPDAKPAE